MKGYKNKQKYPRPVGEPKLLRVLSLGAGVQSSTLYLMAVAGDFGDETPEVAIFADTMWEPKHIYTWLDELERLGGDKLPIIRASVGNLREDALRQVVPMKLNPEYPLFRYTTIPMYTKEDKDGNPKRGHITRRCTRQYKIDVVWEEIRKRTGLTKGQHMLRNVSVEQWIGISADEASRMKTSPRKEVTNRYPLVDMGLTRDDCLNWMKIHGYPEPPKSACIGCPYTSDDRWLAMKRDRPEEFQDAVEFEAEYNRTREPSYQVEAFLHASRQPLDSIDFEALVAARVKRQIEQPNLFENDCEGMCGI